MAEQLQVMFFLVNVYMVIVLTVVSSVKAKGYISAVGDPGMRRDGLRVGFEAWNFCNEVGQQAPGMGSPRAADCFDLLTKPGKCRKHRTSTHCASLIFVILFVYFFFPQVFESVSESLKKRNGCIHAFFFSFTLLIFHLLWSRFFS